LRKRADGVSYGLREGASAVKLGARINHFNL